MARRLERARARYARSATALRVLDPRAALGRGYAIVRAGPDGVALRRSTDVQPGETVSVVLAAGGLDCAVQTVHEPAAEAP